MDAIKNDEEPSSGLKSRTSEMELDRAESKETSQANNKKAENQEPSQAENQEEEKKEDQESSETPSIVEILTLKENFLQTVQNSFFNVDQPLQKDDRQGTKNYLDYIKGNQDSFSKGKVASYYSQCLKGL